MIDILNRFLIQNKSISVPGLGTIHAERIPAKMDIDQSRLIAPVYRFRFDKYFDAPDKNFFTYLSMQKKIPDYEAIRIYNQFAQDFRARIMLEERLEWNEIGYFEKNSSGEIEFIQTENGQDKYLALPVIHSVELASARISGTDGVAPDETIDRLADEEVLIPARKYRPEKMQYMVALVLLALALIATGLQFGKYGFTTKAWSNRQPFIPAKP